MLDCIMVASTTSIASLLLNSNTIMQRLLQGCPCSSELLCQADVNNVMYNHSDCGSTWPYITHVPSPGYWYFIHGGAGAIMSRGLMGLTTYERCQEFVVNGPMPRMSGGDPSVLTSLSLGAEMTPHINVACEQHWRYCPAMQLPDLMSLEVGRAPAQVLSYTILPPTAVLWMHLKLPHVSRERQSSQYCMSGHLRQQKRFRSVKLDTALRDQLNRLMLIT